MRGRVTERLEEKHGVWSRYPQTVLIFPGEPEMMIDLRVPVLPQTMKAFAAIGLDTPFAVLTSHNPRGDDLSDEENARRFEELASELRSDGIEYVVVDGCSPDRSHCECSVAIKLGLREALDIARRWEQVAIFWWDRERFWLYGAISVFEPFALPASLDAETAENII